ALNGANTQTTILLFVFALGAATSLALALLAGSRIFAAMKRSLHASEWIRRGVGALVLAAVGAIFLGVDTGFLTRISTTGTTAIEQNLIDRLQLKTQTAAAPNAPAEGVAPTMMMAPKSAEANNGGTMMMKGNPGAAQSQGLPVERQMPSL